VDFVHGTIVIDNVLSGWLKIWICNTIIILKAIQDGFRDMVYNIMQVFGLQIVLV
jgi:hypothetical protein